MKTKILILLSVSLFCVDAFSRGRLVPRPETKTDSRGVGLLSPTKPAFQAPGLREAGICTGACVQEMERLLPEEAIALLNQSPMKPEEKGVFMAEVLPEVNNQVANYNRVERPATEAVEATAVQVAAVISAGNKSVNWPETARNNYNQFVEELKDGVNVEEARKLEQVEKECL